MKNLSIFVNCILLLVAATSTTYGQRVRTPIIADLGEDCGGFRINPPVCKEPYKCKTNPMIPDAPGICVHPDEPDDASLDEPCGQIDGRTVNCWDPLICVTDDSGNSGTCQYPP